MSRRPHRLWWAGSLELGALEEDLLLELAEGRRGLQAEFLTKDLPDPPVGAQGVGLAAEPVEGHHDLPPGPLP